MRRLLQGLLVAATLAPAAVFAAVDGGAIVERGNGKGATACATCHGADGNCAISSGARA